MLFSRESYGSIKQCIPDLSEAFGESPAHVLAGVVRRLRIQIEGITLVAPQWVKFLNSMWWHEPLEG
jgi:hypothetical protein